MDTKTRRAYRASRDATIPRDAASVAETLPTQEPTLETILDASPYLFCVMDRRGAFHGLNAATEAFFGYSFRGLAGGSVLSLVHPEDRRRALDAVSGAHEARMSDVTLRCECGDGRYRSLEWRLSYDPMSGSVLAWAHEVTESVFLREELRKAQKLVDALWR